MNGLSITLVLALFIAVIIKSATKASRLYVWFPGHISLALMTVCISIHWFTSGQEFVFDYGAVWNVVEKGSLVALSSAVNIAGISSILLGWIYSERDKSTLGKQQIEMIHYKLGYGYGISLVIHFGATALCALMVACEAREAALWAFITILWGCIPQIYICLRITLNKNGQEEIALSLWQHNIQESYSSQNTDARAAAEEIKGKGISVIRDMSVHLDDAEIRHHKEYCENLADAIVKWLEICCNKHHCLSVENIKLGSVIFREIATKVPDEEHELFEEDLLQKVCSYFNVTAKNTPDELILLCCSYYRFLCSKDATEIEQRIHKSSYYAPRNEAFSRFRDIISDFHRGVAWYQFLLLRSTVPEWDKETYQRDEYIATSFEQMVLSIYESDGNKTKEYARISWNQIYPEVK